MEIVTNDLILRSQFKDKYTAIQEIKKSIQILQILRKDTNFGSVFAERNIFRQWEIAPGYSFEQLFNESNELLSRDEKMLLKTILVNFNKIKSPETVFCFEEQESSQCAWAFLNSAMLLSIPVDEKWKSEKIEGILKGKARSEKVEISNLSVPEHIKIHEEQLQIRKYEFNDKHKINIGNISEMDLTDQEAQELLMKAIAADEDTYNHLIAKKNGKYYSFRRHHGNRYHGYRDNTMPEKLRRKVDKCFG